MSAARSGLNRWLRRLGLGLAGVLAVLLLLGLWLLHTSSGARTALGFVPGLKVSAVEGSVAGPLRLQGVALDLPQLSLNAEQLIVDVELWPLLSGAVEIRQLHSKGLQVKVKPAPAAASPPPAAGPLDLPRIKLGGLLLEDSRIEGLTADPLLLTLLSGALETGGARVQLAQLVATLPQGELKADGDFDLLKLAGSFKASIEPRLGPEPVTAMQLSVNSDGNDAKLSLSLPGDAGQFTAQIERMRDQVNYRAELMSPGLELSRLGLPGTVPLPPVELRAVGDRHGVKLDGLVTYANQAYRFDGTELKWNAEALSLAPLRIQPAAGGEIRAEGQLGLVERRADLTVHTSSLPLATWLGPAVGDLELIEGGFAIKGSVLDWTLSGPAHFTRDNIDLRLDLAAAGNGERLNLEKLRLLASFGERPLGTLDLAGSLQLAEPQLLALELQMDDFDLAFLLPDWPGRLQLDAGITGDVNKQLDFDLRKLAGELRGAPLNGAGQLSMVLSETLPTGQLKLEWGGNQLDFSAAKGTPLQLDFALTQPQLFDPELSGRLTGQARLDPEARALELDLQGAALARGDLRVASLDVEASVGAAANAPLQSTVSLTGLSRGDQLIETLRLSTSGRVDAHQLEFELDSSQLQLQLSAAGGWREQSWRGSLDQLMLRPGADAPAAWRERSWTLEQPAALVYGAQSSSLGRLCLRSEPALLCLGGEYRPSATSIVDFELQALSLALAEPMLAGSGLSLSGQLAGKGQLQLVAGATPQGTLELNGQQVEVALEREDGPLRFRLSTLSARVQPDAQGQLQAVAEIVIDKLGRVQLESGLTGSPAVLSVDFASLEALDGLSEAMLKPRGQLKGQLRREGESLTGTIELSGFSAELPAAGLKLSDSRISLRGEPGRIQIDGELKSGAGPLKLLGSFDPAAGIAGLDLAVTGTRFLAADLPQVKLYISPDLKLTGTDGELRIKGELGIPEGLIDLARFEPAVSASPDVVIIDEPLPEVSAGSPVRADVTVVLGDNVQLRGFGLDGRVAGRLSVRERPGRPTTARGEIQVRGTYKAYGQDLTIERGKLLFANSGLDNPGLDIRAVRVIGAIKAGVQVRGSADRPELTVYSEPSMDQLNTISYLVLGRPASEASGGASGAAVQNAAQQLGGNLLAKSIGQKLGLEVGIESSAELGASAFTVGKYLSPKLFVGYGRSLYEQLQLFIVRYKLTDRYELEATSGREQKIGVNYRWER